MDKTLIIYDGSGKIWVQMTGSYTKPAGLSCLEVDIPPGQYAISVDVSKTPHTAILSDPPVDEKAMAIADLQVKMALKDAEMLMVLAAMAETYEAVLPFLPPQY